MSEPVVKRHQVTFTDGLPLGVHGSFVHEGERWIAVPLDKYTAILTVTDRLLGMLTFARERLTRLVSTSPQTASQVVPILAALSRIEDEAVAKAQVQTS